MTSPPLDFSSLSDAEASALLARHRIGLTAQEARKVQDMIGRPPTLTEATIWGIQGSEHCSYKSSRRFLKQFVTDGSHVILGPKEDSGIVAITDGPRGTRWGIVVSHESHNHPSQIVPFEGAATGVGGCVRDVLCMGARVIGCMDNLRLGDLQSEETRVIASEVVRGVAGYANPLGIPNIGGDTVFDAAYNTNCLVNVVVCGLLREDELIHSFAPAEAARERYDIIIVGKATDRSGFGGASFASASMQEDDAESNTGAVQEPNPFLERHLLASTYALFDWLSTERLLHKVSFKDLGAGGVVCATVEQVAASSMGAIVNLDNVHTALQDLPPEVIACAETQERFCWTCHPSLTDRILSHYNDVWALPTVAENACASVVGTVTDDGIFTLTWRGQVVCSAKAEDITSGLQYTRPTRTPSVTYSEPTIACSGSHVSVGGSTFSLSEILFSLLEHPSHASKSRIIRHYDKNILSNSVIEPGEGDATVLMPLMDIERYSTMRNSTDPRWTVSERDAVTGVAFSSGGNGRYGRISPYFQGVNAVVETVRNIAAVGALPRALTDCLNYGNPEIPEHLWALEEGVRGIAEAAKGIAVGGEAIPVISGNVSLYNATSAGSIDPTAIVSCIGVMPDAHLAITMQYKATGSALYLLGERRDECGGSAYYDCLERLTGTARNTFLGARVPAPEFASVLQEILFVTEAISAKLVHACHDISEGGLLLALFEMTLPQRKVGGKLGCSVDLSLLSSPLRNDIVLFSESGGFVLEISERNERSFLSLAARAGIHPVRIGSVTDDARVSVWHGREELLTVSLTDCMKRYETALEVAMAEKKLSS